MIPLDGKVREGRRAARLAAASRSRGRSSATSRFDELRRGRAAPARCRQEPAQPADHGHVPARAVAATSSWSPCSRWPPSTRTAGSASWRWRAVLAVQRPVHAGLLRARRAAASGFRRLQPQYCSIYDPYFWRHERFWKVAADATCSIFNGTPFKNVIWRMLGVQDRQEGLRRRLLRSPSGRLTTSATTARSTRAAEIQCHSQEDGAFKSDRSTIGAGCTLGVGAFVHYGVTMGDGVRARPRLVPDEGRGNPAARAVGRKPGQGDRDMTDYQPG